MIWKKIKGFLSKVSPFAVAIWARFQRFRRAADSVDVLFFVGLFAVFGGLWSSIGFGWGLTAAGAVLIATSVVGQLRG